MKKYNHDKPSILRPSTWSPEARHLAGATAIAGSITAGVVGYGAGQQETMRPEIACTTQMLEPNLEAFSEKYLDVTSPAAKKQAAREITLQTKLTNASNVAYEQDLNLTAEQCTLVVDHDGDVTYFDPANQ